jgi:hypothetical protein
MTTEGNKALVRRLIDEVINGGNLDVAGELFPPDFTYHAPGWRYAAQTG